AETLHQRLHLVACEDAHQIVFERQEEPRRSGIALTSGTTTKLIVDAARFVTLSADDVQTAKANHFLVLFLDDSLRLRKRGLPLLFSGLIGIDLILLQKLARHEIRIAAQQNVRTTTSHVSRDRYHAFASGLRNDLCLTLVILRVQHVVRDLLLQETTRDQFGVLN